MKGLHQLWFNNSQDVPETQTWLSANQGGRAPQLSAFVARMKTAMSSYGCFAKQSRLLSPTIIRRVQYLSIFSVYSNMTENEQEKTNLRGNFVDLFSLINSTKHFKQNTSCLKCKERKMDESTKETSSAKNCIAAGKGA
ncbi:restriction of telomere capping protein 1 [Striga asiatica]|uniref:Restriction of telomere capping protein 1 n=1 Tax=Striga asiatica TaxID=4170 RepID=A0A5A7QIE0_STRAF|nr:restriction of telomere capping protein 1 [Striga asiatica]